MSLHIANFKLLSEISYNFHASENGNLHEDSEPIQMEILFGLRFS